MKGSLLMIVVLFCFFNKSPYLAKKKKKKYIYIYTGIPVFQVHEIQLVSRKRFPETRANFMRLRHFLLVLGKQLALHVIHEKALETLEG